MSRTKLIATFSLAVTLMTMITSNQLLVYASPTTEDDGYTYPDDASEEEKEEIDDREQEAWEDAGRPGEDNDNGDDNENDDGDDEEQQIFTCSDGSTVTEDEECPSTGPNPYCDLVGSNYRGVCHDRKDYSESTGLYPCNDGTQKTDWRDCKDATKKNNDNNNDGPDKTVLIRPPQLSQPQILSTRTCEQIGASDGNGLMFNMEIYNICGDYYTNNFISGCEQFYKDLGFVFVRCERVVEANIAK